MATSNPNFNSPVELNFFGYRIVDNVKHATAENVTASFRYRGYEVAMTTFQPAGAKVIVLLNHVLVGEHGTVEAAITSINELANWQTANQQARDAVMRQGRRWASS